VKRRFSYSDQKSSRHRLGWVILGVVVFFLLYTSFTSLFFSMRVIENNTMAPNLRVGDMLIFSSSNIQNIIPFLNTGKQTFHRGSIVLADISGGEKPGFFKTLADWAIRFFTAQR
jgi:signal peptidase I